MSIALYLRRGDELLRELVLIRRVLQLMERLVSKQLDDVTAAVNAVAVAVQNLSTRLPSPALDESAEFEAVSAKLLAVAEQLNNLLPAPASVAPPA